MDSSRIILVIIYVAVANCFVIEENINHDKFQISEEIISDDEPDPRTEINGESDNPANVFNGVYTECFFHLSYTCLQKKTLLYLKELNRLNEISVIGDYVKFVKLNHSDSSSDGEDYSHDEGQTSDELAYMIDKAVDSFFDNHLIRFSALGKDVLVPNKVEEFVGRKKRKGGGGGGGHGGDGDGGKKKMMMMAMMCMKMKLMMMVPAMMGMMGMMSFKGMMFSMMSFMISKMMLLMKILEKKGGGAGGAGSGDGGWAAAGGGGAWMPTGQDYGSGGGYDANGQWQSRSIIEGKDLHNIHEETSVFSYAKPTLRYNINNKINAVKSLSQLRKVNDEGTNSRHEIKSKSRMKRDSSYMTNIKWQNIDESAITNVLKAEKTFILKETPLNSKVYDEIIEKRYDEIKPKSRKKRGILDILQNTYLYWMNKVLGLGNRRTNNYPKYKVINGVKYVYYPVRNIKVKPKELQHNTNVVTETDSKAVIVDDFNKGEIVEGPIESRMIRKKFHKVKDSVNETMDMIEDNPWE